MVGGDPVVRKNSIRLFLWNDLDQSLSSPKYFYPVNPLPQLRLIVIDKPNRLILVD